MLKIKLKVRNEVYASVKQELEVKGITISDDAPFVLTDNPIRHGYISGRKDDMLHVIKVEDIICLETEGHHYIRVFTSKASFIMRDKLSNLEETLPEIFIRISSSAIVNIHEIKHIAIQIGMRYKLVLTNERTQYVSRSYYYAFKSIIGQ